MLRAAILSLLTALIACAADAHPAPGLVCGTDGAIYFVVVPQPRILVFPSDHKHLASAVDRRIHGDLQVPHHLALREGWVYTASDTGSRVYRFNVADARFESYYPPPGAAEVAPVGIGGDPFCIDPQGNIIASQRMDDGGYRLSRITSRGASTVLAGGARGVQDGRGSKAGFGDLHSTTLAWGSDGAIYLADSGKFIRRVSQEGEVTTLFPPPRPANQEPAPNAITAGELRGVAVGDDGTIYAADATNRCILRLRADGRADRIGIAPADRPDLTLSEPTGVAMHPSGDVVVLDAHRAGDSESIRILIIKPDGSMMHRGTARAR